MSLYFVYIVKYKLKRGSVRYYTGYTNDPTRRKNEHCSGNGAKCLRGVTIFDMRIVFENTEQKLAMRKELEIKKLPSVKKSMLYELNKPKEIE